MHCLTGPGGGVSNKLVVTIGGQASSIPSINYSALIYAQNTVPLIQRTWYEVAEVAVIALVARVSQQMMLQG